MEDAASPSDLEYWETEISAKEKLLSRDYVHIHVSSPVKQQRKLGTLFLEARLKDGFLQSDAGFECEEYANKLRAQLLSGVNTFELLEDLLADEQAGPFRLGNEYARAKAILQSLKVVEHIGPTSVETIFSSENVKLKIQVFELYNTPSSLNNTDEAEEELGEIFQMPHVRFEGVWDELFFDHDIKADLIWMMTNLLRFSQAFAANHLRRKLNPVILLYGPPGTGKSSLCQGLAQKISIRLGAQYKSTRLIQIKTATLLSKYFSESSKHVDETFTKISQMCEEDPERFICVLIDEVESIASSRQFSAREGESFDSLRATNALLTGLDRTAKFSNVAILCTSNMCDVLEPAFLDRCGIQEFVGPPSVAAQYEILRSVLQKLIECKVIGSNSEFPPFDEAEYQAVFAPRNAGPKLLEIVKLIRNTNSSLQMDISGRCLAQLPEQALMRYLRDEDCDGDMALRFMEKAILDMPHPEGSSAHDIGEARQGKRSWDQYSEEECDAHVRGLEQT
ncbi:thyroid hormone receptor interactor [Diplocarpon rosae]|nr:thyroid hormone receptor interactor [Diplocarpon rosae]